MLSQKLNYFTDAWIEIDSEICKMLHLNDKMKNEINFVNETLTNIANKLKLKSSKHDLLYIQITYLEIIRGFLPAS